MSGVQFYVRAERVHRCRGEIVVNTFLKSYNDGDQRFPGALVLESRWQPARIPLARE
jgi:hypothetical protein